jgi:putative MFS transporter
VVSAVVLALRHGTPESPRWLVEKGRADEARELITQVLAVPVTADQLVEAKADSIRPGRIRQLFRGLFLRRILFITLLYTCQVIPMWALLTFGPQLLSAFGFESDLVDMLGPALISALFLIGCIPALRLLETRGRRPVAIWSFALMTVPLSVLGLWQGAPIWAVIGCFCLYAFFAGAPGILEWLYPNELFPTAIRASAVGTAVALSKVGAAIGTYLVPVSLTHLGLAPTMYAGVVITAIGLLACVAWAEETTDRSLHEASAAPLALPAAGTE